MNIHNNELTVEVYVRPDELVEPIDTKIDTLRQLDSADHIDNLLLHAWPGAITLTDQTPYSDAIDAFEQMEAWADEHGVSIQPPFTVRTTTSTFTNETQTKLQTPMMCLAVYAGEQLANVFPHSRGDDHHGVMDAIAALRTDDIELFPFAPDSAAPPPSHCLECDTLLTTVQGLGICQDCDRIEIGTTPRRERGQQSRLTLRP
ncbi:HTH domain-containing protein [Natronococcus wangiae]|uniref:HTH domain-containing protein n=1 Tax=Natronococcus wangiae TaxID=3068275 RepID=UPI00273FD5E6|nr:HTH domain-containing protein [Natronococcus sp. AD5]